MKFDLRVSRQDLHLYEVRRTSRADGQSVYITTYSAAGDAVAAEMTAVMKGQSADADEEQPLWSGASGFRAY